MPANALPTNKFAAALLLLLLQDRFKRCLMRCDDSVRVRAEQHSTALIWLFTLLVCSLHFPAYCKWQHSTPLHSNPLQTRQLQQHCCALLDHVDFADRGADNGSNQRCTHVCHTSCHRRGCPPTQLRKILTKHR
jgi:hypothetical protein